MASASARTNATRRRPQIARAPLGPPPPARNPDRVLASPVRPPVEPAVVRHDLETGPLDHGAPLVRGAPREHHRRLFVPAADGERERPLVDVPVGALEDPGLALEPAAVRLRDVV